MKQIEFSLPANVWAGLNTRYDVESKYVTSDEFTSGSVNYELAPTGSVTKRASTEVYNSSALSSPIRDEFEMIFQSGVRHKLVMSAGNLYYTTGDGIFHLVHAGYTAIANMEFAAYANRAYFGNGFDNPQVYDIGTTYGGVTYTPPTVADMGTKAPSSPLTIGSPTSGGSVPVGVHTYKYTYLYYDAQESNGSPVSGTVTISTNQTVPLSAITVGGLGVTARKIYRDDNDGAWALVGTITNNTATTFTDTQALTTTPIPTDNNTPPQWSLVVEHRDRLWVAGVSDAQTTLYYSDAGLPDVWPTNNFIGCNPKDTITGLTQYNDRVVVFGKTSFGIILGTTSDDFRYTDVSPNIGCVDNRSIQTITVLGVPKLQWLSALGIYQWDGANLQFISDKINNLLKFNIQQASGTTNKNIQTTQADFEAGTTTPGIDLDSIPGSIALHGYLATTNPTKNWDSETEWEAGSSLTNVVTSDGSNTISAPLEFTQSFDDQTLVGSIISVSGGTHAELPVTSDYAGYTGIKGAMHHFGNDYNSGAAAWVAVPFKPPRSGVLNSVTFEWIMNNVSQSTEARIYSSDSVQPVSLLATSSNFSYGGGLVQHTFGFSIALAGGTEYWMVLKANGGSINNGITDFRTGSYNPPNNYLTMSDNGARSSTPGVWQVIPDYGWTINTFTSDPIASSGAAITTVYDSNSTSIPSALINQHTTTFNPSLSTSTLLIEAADDLLMTMGLLSQTVVNPVGSTVITIANKRYWRITSTLSTTDNRDQIVIDMPTLYFPNTSTWISEVIDHTLDIVSLDDLITTSTIISGSTVVTTIATSTDNITYSSFTDISLATPHRYSKVKVVITNPDSTDSSFVSSVLFNWTITGQLISSAINTIVTPAGWGLFQEASILNSGTVVFEARSAASSGALTSATWFTVTNGVTIGVPIEPWIQWRVTLTASANQEPRVSSVTINWLITNTAGIRVASLFYDQTYYIAAAEFGSTTNNIVIYYDWQGRWGQFSGLTINTMGLFFGNPYYGDAIVGNYVKWLDPSVINSTVIDFDIRTKSFADELVSNSNMKYPRHLIVRCLDYLSTIYPEYSINEGVDWIAMTDVVTGLNYYTGLGTNKQVVLRFTTDSSTIVWGYGLMFRIRNSDQYPVQINDMRAKVTVSDRPVLVR